MSLKSIKFMLLMLCSALKLYCFQMFKKSYEVGINKLFFSREEKYSLKKETMWGRRTSCVKKG